jgi:hypothetical protein
MVHELKGAQKIWGAPFKAVFFHLKMLKSTPKCHKLTLEILKMQKDPIWASNQMAKKFSAPQKNPKIDLWEITGCTQIQEIERPVLNILFACDLIHVICCLCFQL